jgi:NAD(P)-dependent dehydrogenase (short-subunit alcohol dehydrogenase family)
MASMQGKVVLVTGAAGAIGKPMCVELARRGATLVMAGRGERIRDAATEVGLAGRAEVLAMDLASLESVRKAAADFERRFDRLDVLINNAAVFSGARKITADGHELQFGTNHLGHFLLTNLLLGKLKASAPARVVMMTMGTTLPIPFDDLDSKSKYSGVQALQRSKAAITCFGVELARRLEGTGVTVNLVNPELTKSTLPREAPLPLRAIFALFGASPDRAKDYGIRVACDDALANVSGRFYRKDVEKPIPPAYTDPQVRARLWVESARRVSLQ